MAFSAGQKREYRRDGTDKALAYREREKKRLQALADTPEEKQRQLEKSRRYRTDQTPEAIERRSKEQSRSSARSYQKWHGHNCIICTYDGEAQDNGNYRWLQVLSERGDAYTYENEDGQAISMSEAAWWFKEVRTHQRERYGVHNINFYGFSTGYDFDQLIGNDPNISHEQKKILVNHRRKDWGMHRKPGWTNEVVIEPAAIAIHNGRSQVSIRFLRRDLEGKFIIDENGSYKSFTKLTLYDCYSLTAQTFLKTMKMMIDGLPDEREALLPLYDIVEQGKEARGYFAASGMDTYAILSYNLAELRLLSRYIRLLIELCEREDIHLCPRNFSSPGSFARAGLVKHGLTEHIKPSFSDTLDFYHSKEYKTIKSSYYGGRIELSGVGELQEFHQVDMNSAYPSIIANLPCLAHGHFSAATEEEIAEANQGRVTEYGMWDISWRTYKKDRFGPFPVRRREGSIDYPLQGMGTYHSPEVAMYAKYARGTYTVHSGIIWHPSCHCVRPFKEMIDKYYELRLLMKERNDIGQLVIKLMMNSLYGIFAQRVGSHLEYDEDGQIVSWVTPKFCNLFAAGLITSQERAHLYGIYCEYPKEIIGFATDAVQSFGPLPMLEYGDGIGQWKQEHIKERTQFVAPGYIVSENRTYQKTRGMPPTQDIARMIREAREKGKTTVTFGTMVYVDMRLCYHEGGVRPWGTFVPTERAFRIDEMSLRNKREFYRNKSVGGMVMTGAIRGSVARMKEYDPMEVISEDALEREMYVGVYDE